MLTAIPRPRAPLTATPLHRVDILVWAEPTHPGYIWGASIDDGEPTISVGGATATRDELIAQVNTLIRRTCSKTVGDVVVYPRAPEGTLAGLTSIMPSQARIRDFEEALSIDSSMVKLAHLACTGLITGADEVIATDGSVSLHTGHSGFGWISARGAFGVGITEHSDIVTVELAGIRNALARVREEGSGIILTDSQPSIDLIERYLSFGDGGMHASRPRKAQLHAIERSAIRSMRVQKVKAHNGHWLNEGADRLARLARMASESSMPEKELWEAAAHIRDDVLRHASRSSSQRVLANERQANTAPE